MNFQPVLTIAITLPLCMASGGHALSADGNRLTYLDEPCDPYYVHAGFPKLTTPQWVGEPGVEAVVVLAIDDMRDTAKYEAYLRPILDRLKAIDGRAPVSIMTCDVSPEDPQLERWLEEGLSIEVHTVDHPCPLLQGGDLSKAKSTYDRCVDLLARIPGNRPVAYRMPCCDSLNTPSPRFWTEIFNQSTPNGHFLSLDSSVFQIFTSDDKELPAELVVDPDGRERFRKYLPFPSFVNTIENYPYPYVIARRCWEFPCMVPSDWEAQNLHRPNNPTTVQDMQAALDATVVKQGVFNLVFHPHGWIRSGQVVELIDYVVEKHGRKVKFLTFRQALDQLNSHLLDGHPLRTAEGGDGNVWLLDVNDDGYMDVVRPEGDRQIVTKVWSPEGRRWTSSRQHAALSHPRFGVARPDGFATLVTWDGEKQLALMNFENGRWMREDMAFDDSPSGRRFQGTSQDIRNVHFRDLDGDGSCELFLTDSTSTAIFRRRGAGRSWTTLPFTFPAGVEIAAADGGDAGLRFVDLDNDGHDDIVFSNSQRFSVHRFAGMQAGWSDELYRGVRTAENGIPMIVRADGTNNGAWFHSGHLWVQNEDTHRLPDLVDRRAWADWLGGKSSTAP